MKLYKLKHIPTGLFYTPSKGHGNLSRTGKVYIGRKPKLEYCSIVRVVIHSFKETPDKNQKLLLDAFNIEWNGGWIDKYFKTVPSDWVIIEIDAKKQEIEKIVADIHNKLSPMKNWIALNKVVDEGSDMKYITESEKQAEINMPIIEELLNKLLNL